MKFQEGGYNPAIGSKEDDERMALPRARQKVHADSEEYVRKNDERANDDPKKYRDITNKPGFDLRKKKMKKK